METKKTSDSPTKETNNKKTNDSEKPKKKNRGKAKPISANELLNTQPTQPAPQQPPQQQQIPQPQGQFVFNAPAGFVPVVPVMAYTNYNFANAPVQVQQQQFFAAMPFGAHQPPVPGAPIPQMQPAQAYPQYMPMQQFVPTQNAQPAAASTKPYTANGKGSYNKKYQEKAGSKGKDYKDNQQKDVNQMIYQKYKTTLCRHYEENGTCSLGHLCSFAHSKSELRSINDPMPRDFAGKKSQIGALHSNYKTRMCTNWTETGTCKFGAMCCFAHGDEQLRNMIDPVPQRVPESLLFPPHMQKGSANKNARADQQYQPEDQDYQGDYSCTDYDQNGYQEVNFQQQDQYEMQPQDYDHANYWGQTYEQQPQFFTGNMPSAPVWQPSSQQPMPQPPAQACNQATEQQTQEVKADDQVMA